MSCDAGGVTLSEDALPDSDGRSLVMQVTCGVGAAQFPATTAKGIPDISSTDGREPSAGAAVRVSQPGMFTTEIAVFAAEPPTHPARIECEITSGVWTGTTLALEVRARHGCAALLVVGIPDRLWRASENKWVDFAHKLQQGVQGIVVVEVVRGQAAARDEPE